MNKIASTVLLAKLASRDPAARLLIKQACILRGLNKEAAPQAGQTPPAPAQEQKPQGTQTTPATPPKAQAANTSYWNQAQDYMRKNWGDVGNWLADNGENVAWAGGTAATLYGLTGLMDPKGKHRGKRALLSAASIPVMWAAGKHIVPYYKNVWEQHFNKPKA